MAENNVRLEEEEERNICSICLGELTGEIGNPAGCIHEFCLECIRRWAEQSNTCPMDRHIFNIIIVKCYVCGEVMRLEAVNGEGYLWLLDEEIRAHRLMYRILRVVYLVELSGARVADIRFELDHDGYPEPSLPRQEPSNPSQEPFNPRQESPPPHQSDESRQELNPEF